MGVSALTALGTKVGLAVALAVGATAVARCLYHSRPNFRPRQRTLRVLETTALGQHRTIHLVAVGRRTLLLASAANQITVLADVSAEQQARPAETPSVKPGFSAVLNQLLGCNPPVQTSYIERLRAAAAALRADGASGGQQ